MVGELSGVLSRMRMVTSVLLVARIVVLVPVVLGHLLGARVVGVVVRVLGGLRVVVVRHHWTLGPVGVCGCTASSSTQRAVRRRFQRLCFGVP